MNGIESLANGTERHLNHTKDNGSLHLEGVHESDLSGGSKPDWVHTNWVDAVISLILTNEFLVFSLSFSFDLVAALSKDLSSS